MFILCLRRHQRFDGAEFCGDVCVDLHAASNLLQEGQQSASLLTKGGQTLSKKQKKHAHTSMNE